MINESGTMSGGGGKPRGGRMCIGQAAPKQVDARAAQAELQAAEQELAASQEVGLGRAGRGAGGGFVRATAGWGADRSNCSGVCGKAWCGWQLCSRLAAAEQVFTQMPTSDSLQGLQAARRQLSEAAAQAKQAERALADLETAIPKVGWLGWGVAMLPRCPSGGLQQHGRQAQRNGPGQSTLTPAPASS